MPNVPAYRTYGFDPIGVPTGLSLLPGLRQVFIRGHNPAVPVASLPQDLIEPGGTYTFQTSAQSVEILSADANDKSGDTGARTVLVQGLDGNYLEVEETATMNGATPVALTQKFLRINNMVVVTAGSSKANEGIITLRVAGAGATMATMGAGDSILHAGIYTVPAKHTMFIMTITPGLSVATGGYAVCNIQVRDNNASADAPFITRLILHIWGVNTVISHFIQGFKVTEKTDIRYRISNLGTNNSIVSLFSTALLMLTSE